MSYLRVIPRDLFNEAKLLKCLGAVYIAAERNRVEALIELEHDGSSFKILQDASSGAIYVDNVRVIVNGVSVHVYTPLNSRAPYPLYFDHGDETEAVFADDTGAKLSDAFLAVGKVRKNPSRWGTSHFVSRRAAVRYYSDYEDDAEHAVERKLAAGEIHIGPPDLKPGQRLEHCDDGTRYAIVEG
jgi:hypothetical protein